MAKVRTIRWRQVLYQIADEILKILVYNPSTCLSEHPDGQLACVESKLDAESRWKQTHKPRQKSGETHQQKNEYQERPRMRSKKIIDYIRKIQIDYIRSFE